jgi:hypothetical protein
MKYSQLWPYSKICKGIHLFGELDFIDESLGYGAKCSRCGWVKYKEEYEAEAVLSSRLKKEQERGVIKRPYLDLFHY